MSADFPYERDVDAQHERERRAARGMLALTLIRPWSDALVRGHAYALLVRLRYRVQAGTVTFAAALHRADQAFRDAFEEACTIAQERTGIPLFHGSPEA